MGAHILLNLDVVRVFICKPGLLRANVEYAWFFQLRLSTFSHTSHRTVSLRVNTHVLLKLLDRRKTLLAHITFVRFLVRVNTHVPFQITRFTKTLLAHITFVRFLVRVNTHVVFKSLD